VATVVLESCRTDAQRSALSLVKKNRWLVEKRRDLRFDLADVELVEPAAIRRCGISHPIEATFPHPAAPARPTPSPPSSHLQESYEKMKMAKSQRKHQSAETDDGEGEELVSPALIRPVSASQLIVSRPRFIL